MNDKNRYTPITLRGYLITLFIALFSCTNMVYAGYERVVFSFLHNNQPYVFHYIFFKDRETQRNEFLSTLPLAKDIKYVDPHAPVLTIKEIVLGSTERDYFHLQRSGTGKDTFILLEGILNGKKISQEDRNSLTVQIMPIPLKKINPDEIKSFQEEIKISKDIWCKNPEAAKGCSLQ